MFTNASTLVPERAQADKKMRLPRRTRFSANEDVEVDTRESSALEGGILGTCLSFEYQGDPMRVSLKRFDLTVQTTGRVGRSMQRKLTAYPDSRTVK